MSLTASHFDQAIAEIMQSPFGDKLAAVHALQREHARWSAEKNHTAWSDGFKGDGVSKIPGLTDTLTQLVRRFAACAVVRYADMEDLHRHVSALRKRLKEIAPSVQIETIIGEGYEVTQGFDHLFRLLHAGKTPATRAPGFTVKETAILSHLALRGSVHVDQIACLQRHMSNIRAKLKKQGFTKSIGLETHSGEGLYTVTKGREALGKLVAGELVTPAVKAKSAPQPKRIPPGKPTLQIVAEKAA